MTKEKNVAKAKEKNDHVAFTMATSSYNPKNGRKIIGEPIDIVAPADSLDKDGEAESALGGEFRYA